MKKFFLILLLIVAVAAGGVYFYLNTIIEHAVEVQGSKITGSVVTLSAARVSPLSGDGSLKGLVIRNPAGFKGEYAFSLDELRVKMQPETLLEDTIVIDQILVNLPDVSYEIAVSGDNISVLRKNIQKNTSAMTREENSEEKPKTSKKLLVHELRITGGIVHLAADIYGQKSEQVVKLPEIVLHDIGSDSGGVTPAQLSNLIAGAVLKNVNTQAVRGQLEGLARGGLGKLRDGVKENLLDKMPKLF